MIFKIDITEKQFTDIIEMGENLGRKTSPTEQAVIEQLRTRQMFNKPLTDIPLNKVGMMIDFYNKNW